MAVVAVICPRCRWRSHRTPRGCEMDHVGPCSCSLGSCPKCKSWLETFAWNRWWRKRSAEIELMAGVPAAVEEVAHV